MAYSKRQIVTVLSAVFLVFLTGVASYALHLIRFYSLPIPTFLGALTVGLPAIAGLSLESAIQFRRQSSQIASTKHRLQRGHYVTVAVCILLILETAVATLSGTYIAPIAGLACGLDNEWLRLFRAKDGTRIQRIQDSLDCCGLHSVKDKAYPFPSSDVSVKSCSTRYGRNASCFDGWRREERKAASVILAVTVVVALWKVRPACQMQCVIFTNISQILVVTNPLNRDNESWLHEILPDQTSNRLQHSRAIEYPDTQAGYQDDPEGRASNDLVGAVPTTNASGHHDPPLSPTLASRFRPPAQDGATAQGWGNVEEQ